MAQPDTTSREMLAGSAYKDAGHLEARQSLYDWQEPTYDLPGLVLEQLPADLGRVLDLGCGNGKFVQCIRDERPVSVAIGMDISAGIIAGIAPPIVAADAAAIPLKNGAVDVVLALHMLYHVEDLSAALNEIRRVLSAPGMLIASTNANEDKHQLDELWSKAAGQVLGVAEGQRRISLSERFPLNDAPALLGNVFADIELIELPGVITLTSADPVVRYYESYRSWANTAGVPFEETIARARAIVEDHIQSHGNFRIDCLGGILICR